MDPHGQNWLVEGCGLSDFADNHMRSKWLLQGLVHGIRSSGFLRVFYGSPCVSWSWLASIVVVQKLCQDNRLHCPGRMARGERTRVKLGAWSAGQGLRVNGALEGQEQPEGLPGTTASNRAHFSVTQGVFGGTAGGVSLEHNRQRAAPGDGA